MYAYVLRHFYSRESIYKISDLISDSYNFAHGKEPINKRSQCKAFS
jgi:hypothetical protein